MTLLWVVAGPQESPLGGCPLRVGLHAQHVLDTLPGAAQDSLASGVPPDHSCHILNPYHVPGFTLSHAIREPNNVYINDCFPQFTDTETEVPSSRPTAHTERSGVDI